MRAALCRLQELPLYADASSLGEVAEDTQLAVFKKTTTASTYGFGCPL
jgi:hypothetical protein